MNKKDEGDFKLTVVGEEHIHHLRKALLPSEIFTVISGLGRFIHSTQDQNDTEDKQFAYRKIMDLMVKFLVALNEEPRAKAQEFLKGTFGIDIQIMKNEEKEG